MVGGRHPLPPKMGDRSDPPPFKNRSRQQIYTCNISTLRATEKFNYVEINLAEASTRETVHVSSVITSTGSRATIRHAHGFPCSSQPYYQWLLHGNQWVCLIPAVPVSPTLLQTCCIKVCSGAGRNKLLCPSTLLKLTANKRIEIVFRWCLQAR